MVHQVSNLAAAALLMLVFSYLVSSFARTVAVRLKADTTYL